MYVLKLTWNKFSILYSATSFEWVAINLSDKTKVNMVFTGNSCQPFRNIH